MFDDSHDIIQLWKTHICFAQPHKISVVRYQTDFQKQGILPQSQKRKEATPSLCVLAWKSFEKNDYDHEDYRI